jgi:hypothetical protein
MKNFADAIPAVNNNGVHQPLRQTGGEYLIK